MSTVYVTAQGATVGKTGERLKVTCGKDVLLDMPLIKVSQVVILGHVSVTPAALSLLMKRGIEIVYLTQHGQYVARVQPEISKNSLLRLEQYKALLDEARRLNLARGCVAGKLANLRMTLTRKASASAEVKQAIARIKKAEKAAKTTDSLNALRGHEGDGSAAYFGVFRHLLKTENFTFETRTRRPPTDPINALLSFGYTLLMNDLYSAVNLVGFDPYAGYLHAEHYGRPSLPLDLMEEFRPLIVDAMVTACVNKNILTPAHFSSTEAGTSRLSEEGRHIFLEQYEARRKTEFTHPVLNQKMTYQQAFEQQTRQLARTLQGELAEYPPLLMK